MFYVVFFIVLAVSFFVGVLGFCQIIGSIQTRQRAHMFTILLWAAILIGGFLAVKNWIPQYLYALYAGYIISFISSLRAGKIE